MNERMLATKDFKQCKKGVEMLAISVGWKV